MTSKTHRFTTCHRHPTKPVTGFCASCLRERLAGIESSPASPELRRIKSFSGADAPSPTVPEPRRRSCEVLAPPPHGSLSDLFNVHDEKKKNKKEPPHSDLAIHSETSGVEIWHDGGGDAVKICDDDEVDDEETKTMKEFIDLELRSQKNAGRDFRDIAASFRSVFSKRLMKWRRKQKPKKNRNDDGGLTAENERLGLRTTRETQSEVGEYGLALGRRSCDTDPRLSIDDSRFSFEASRASWDGYLIGKSCPRVFSPMVNVDERVLVEEEEEEVNFPGGSAQTKHYYSDWQRRKRSFDRSNSRRKSLMCDVEELRVVSNAKVSPATTELFYGAKVLITENDLRDSGFNPLNSAQSGSGSKGESACDVANRVDQKGLNKFHKLGRLWNKLGLVQRRKENSLGEEVGDTVNKPVAESWQKLRRVVNGQASESVSQKLIRSYSVSCGDPCRMTGLVNETKGHVLNGRQKLMVQRNRSVNYSPNNADTGLLRFYLTPLKSCRRSRSGKSSLKDGNPAARNFL